MNNTLLPAIDTNLVPVYAEIFLLIAASAILLIDMYLKGRAVT
jgi:NADH-quinone oxidoreductase subunit N